ncbi:helix-turn-helix transcriptional regulator [Weissella koreensis]|uniref:helix-turn-helix domain-containing protein n=1 Tax=Weissella koreensis TaxID=165096 RepID=UPI0022BA5D47|nr:helix-turn-helix transcriptional regulator [Weissella koreensis]MCZ9310645.1 helix-turn-helix transcriptional regulator [Weissella koreensis]
MEISEVIQKYLDKNNSNWSRLSKGTGITRDITYGIKKNKRNLVSLKTIVKISNYLEIDMNEFKDVKFK